MQEPVRNAGPTESEEAEPAYPDREIVRDAAAKQSREAAHRVSMQLVYNEVPTGMNSERQIVQKRPRSSRSSATTADQLVEAGSKRAAFDVPNVQLYASGSRSRDV